MKHLVTILVMMLVITSCSMKNVSPVDEAAIIGDQLTTQYINLYKKYKLLEKGDDITPALTGENLVKLRSLAPAMNEVKSLLIVYNDLVIQWKSSGEEPSDLLHNRELITRLLSTITVKLLNL